MFCLQGLLLYFTFRLSKNSSLPVPGSLHVCQKQSKSAGPMISYTSFFTLRTTEHGASQHRVLQLWDRDLWIRTETNPRAYSDKFRPAEQLFAACVKPRSSVEFLQHRDKNDAGVKAKEAAEAAKARQAEKYRYQKLIQQQEKLLNILEPSEENAQWPDNLLGHLRGDIAPGGGGGICTA